MLATCDVLAPALSLAPPPRPPRPSRSSRPTPPSRATPPARPTPPGSCSPPTTPVWRRTRPVPTLAPITFTTPLWTKYAHESPTHTSSASSTIPAITPPDSLSRPLELDASNGRSKVTPPTMPTPPRLPSSSPSSARLRRLAPSPVKVPQLIDFSSRPKPLPNTHSSATRNRPAAHPRPHPSPAVQPKHAGALSPSPLEDPFEFDFAPVDRGLNAQLMHSPPEDKLAHTRRFSLSPDQSFLAGPSSRNDSVDSGSSIPVIYDGQGTYARLARRLRDELGPDVPDELTYRAPSSSSDGSSGTDADGDDEDEGTPPRRSGPAMLTPVDYYAECVPCPVLVQFRDVFAKQQQTISPEAVSPKSSRMFQLPEVPRSAPLKLPTQSPSPPRSLPPSPRRQGSDSLLPEPTRLVRDHSLDSVGTFGPRTAPGADLTSSPPSPGALMARRPSTDTVGEDDDGWSYTLSAYGDDLTSRGSTRNSPNPPPAPMMPCLELEPDDSPYSTADLELVTPDHDDVDLPSRNGSLASTISTNDTPTPKSNRYGAYGAASYGTNDTLGLSLGLGIGGGLGADMCPSPSVTLVSASGMPSAIPSATPTIYLTHSRSPTPDKPIHPEFTLKHKHSRTPTLDKALPSLPDPSPPPTTSVTQPTPTPTLPLASPTPSACSSIEKSTTVQLWVDQEGMRDVCSTLHYVRSHRAGIFREREIRALHEASMWCESPTKPELFQQSGCVEFGMDPKERDKWIFHHAPLEGLPILRRLTINGDDKYDYLNRGASLSIKDPGVYTVSGTEERGRVEWKFEYLVTPRISDRTGELLNNEKTVVPLALYVSPNFFEPERASRTHLYNVFKKTLTTNIPAVKLRTPHVGKPPASQPPTPSFPQPTPTPPPSATIPTAPAVHAETSSTSSHDDSDSSPVPTSGKTRTFGVFAKAMGNGAPAPVHKFGTKPPSIGKPGSSRLATPDTAASIVAGTGVVAGAEDVKKGRTRARTLFSRSRPFTPPANITSLHPVPLVPMKSLSSLHAGDTGRHTPSNSITSNPTASASVTSIPSTTGTPTTAAAPRPLVTKGPTHVRSTSSHPFATQVTPLVSGSAPLGVKAINIHGIPQAQEIMIESATNWNKSMGTSKGLHEEMLKVEEGTGAGVRGGLSPAPRGFLRKRPSTAEPRLGTVAAFGHGRA